MDNEQLDVHASELGGRMRAAGGLLCPDGDGSRGVVGGSMSAGRVW